MNQTPAMQIDHVELFVPDRYEAAAWYERVLGLKIVPALEHFADDPKGPLMISTPAAPTKLALFQGETRGCRRGTGFYRVAFAAQADSFVQFLDQLPVLKLRSAGNRIIGEQDVVDHGKAWSLYFCDPWGHCLEITTYAWSEVQSLLDAR